jgi:hypothetical protein
MAKPAAATLMVDLDFGSRVNAVITITTAINNLLFYYYGNTTHNLKMPDPTSSNNYIVGSGTGAWNSSVLALNAVITAASLATTPLLTITSLDSHDFQSQWNKLITFNNAVLAALP